MKLAILSLLLTAGVTLVAAVTTLETATRAPRYASQILFTYESVSLISLGWLEAPGMIS